MVNTLGAAPVPRVEHDGLPDSTPLIDHPEELRARWETDGVLYFHQVVDPVAIAAVRDNYIARLQELGLVAQGATEPTWTGVNKVDGKHASKIDDRVWQQLVHEPSFARPIRAFLGKDPAWVPIVVHRSAPPVGVQGADIHQGRHQDGVFNFGIEFITCWVPLMDIDAQVGGLAVVPGSHKRSYYDYAEDEIPNQAGAIAPGRIADELWRRPDYKVGDILMFHGMTAHTGLPNTSDRFRLSIDVRYVPKPDPAPMVGTVTGFDGQAVQLTVNGGEEVRLTVDDGTMVRGPKGNRVLGDALSSVLFEGANVIAMPDRPGHARLVRSVSRKYIDVPAAWFSELPSGWVN